MTERIIIDLAVCDRCEQCTAGPAALALREKATFELVGRRCEQASCVMACPFAALERTEEGIVKRHNMRCVSCKSCALACPFGTIYMELLPYIDRLWLGEGFNANHAAWDFWLVEMSGLPFGLMGEMLQDGGNPWRGNQQRLFSA